MQPSSPGNVPPAPVRAFADALHIRASDDERQVIAVTVARAEADNHFVLDVWHAPAAPGRPRADLEIDATPWTRDTPEGPRIRMGNCTFDLHARAVEDLATTARAAQALRAPVAGTYALPSGVNVWPLLQERADALQAGTPAAVVAQVLEGAFAP